MDTLLNLNKGLILILVTWNIFILGWSIIFVLLLVYDFVPLNPHKPIRLLYMHLSLWHLLDDTLNLALRHTRFKKLQANWIDYCVIGVISFFSIT